MNRLASLLIIAILFVTSGTAYADSIEITFTEIMQSGPVGTTLTFDATLTNLTGSTIFLNGDSFITSSPFLRLDDNPFLTNAPLFLTADASSGPIALFNVFIAPGATPGTYDLNSFTILGGSSGFSLTPLGSGEFCVNVAPEPGTIVLVGSGLLGLALMNLYKKMRT